MSIIGRGAARVLRMLEAMHLRVCLYSCGMHITLKAWYFFLLCYSSLLMASLSTPH